MKKLLILFFLFLSFLSYSQVQCGANAGFETGTFTGWSGNTGICVDVNCDISSMTPGLVNGRQTIMSGGLFDSYTCNNVPVVCPFGGTYSMRLGNSNVNWETEDIEYTYTVSASNPILLYAYAAVLQDPNHPDSVQPAFKTYIKDINGVIVPCSYYKVNATQLRGGQLCNWWYPNIWYKNWTKVAIDMSAYAGQTVTLYFKTNDCGWGAHFGYAYIDVLGCYPKQITLSGCAGSTSITLTAPPGFQTYLWNTGQNTQSITVNPFFTPSVICTITSFQGCQIVLTANTQLPSPFVNFTGNDVCLCDNLLTNFTNFTTTSGSPIIRWDWDFGDGSPHSFLQNPTHQYLAVGTYTVSLIVTTSDGCNYGLTKQVRVYPCATVSMIRHN